MLFRAAFMVLPLAALAQTPPPEVDETLRARVTEFFQYHVDGNFRKAYDLVADDTKDQYFAAQKTRFKSFKIDYIRYSSDFTKADVQLTTERTWRMRPDLPETVMAMPMATTWKIENGKWVWSQSEAPQVQLPMGPSAVPPKANASGAPKLPNVSQGAIAAAARNILQQSSIDKAQVVLATDKPSSDQVVFHNGFPGSVRVVLDAGAKLPGLKAELNKTELNAGENAVLKVSYQPPDKDPRPPLTLRLTVAPFNQVFTIAVSFGAPSKEAARK